MNRRRLLTQKTSYLKMCTPFSEERPVVERGSPPADSTCSSVLEVSLSEARKSGTECRGIYKERGIYKGRGVLSDIKASYQIKKASYIMEKDV
jgi:hypothetical protein